MPDSIVYELDSKARLDEAAAQLDSVYINFDLAFRCTDRFNPNHSLLVAVLAGMHRTANQATRLYLARFVRGCLNYTDRQFPEKAIELARSKELADPFRRTRPRQTVSAHHALAA
jgi:hypothetical protein